MEHTRPTQAFDRAARPISELIAGLLKDIGLEPDFAEQQIVREWDKIVGPAVARQTRPGKLENKTLSIYVTNSMWLQELQRYHRQKILANLRPYSASINITDIRFVLDPNGGRNPTA